MCTYRIELIITLISGIFRHIFIYMCTLNICQGKKRGCLLMINSLIKRIITVSHKIMRAVTSKRQGECDVCIFTILKVQSYKYFYRRGCTFKTCVFVICVINVYLKNLYKYLPFKSCRRYIFCDFNKTNTPQFVSNNMNACV